MFVYKGLSVIINSVRVVMIVVTIIGIFEMVTCNHFKTSMLCSDIYLNAYFDSYGFINRCDYGNRCERGSEVQMTINYCTRILWRDKNDI